MAIILHRRKESTNGLIVEKSQTHQKLSGGFAEKSMVESSLIAKVQTSVCVAPSTNTIDFMAIWIYLAAFLIFNVIYWNVY